MNWKQFVALVKLRFLLTKNQLQQHGTLNSVSFSIAFVCLLMMALWSFFGSVFFGAYLFGSMSTDRIALIWNVLTLVLLGAATIEFVNRVQMDDAIEVDRMLHLPITFRGAFILNYASSLISFNMLMLAPVIIGLAIAVPIAAAGEQGWQTIIAIPLAISFIFLVTALMYLARGLIADRMKNKRTKGWLALIIPLVFVGGILVVSNLFESDSLRQQFVDAPVGWLSAGIFQSITYGNFWPGFFFALSMTVGGCACLYYAYLTDMKKYTGADVGAKVSKGMAASSTFAASGAWANSRQFKKLPGVNSRSSSVALAAIKSLLRAPEILAAFMPVAATFFFGAPYLLGWKGYDVPEWAENVLPIGMIGITLIGFPAFLFSTFSYVRDGFRSYMLSPVARKEILHGRNVGIGILTVACGWISVILLQCFQPCGLSWFLGTLVQIPAAYLLLCVIGNLISVFLPIGFKRGSMTPVNVQIIPAIAIYVGVFVGPALAMAPTLVSYTIATVAETYMNSPTGWIYLLLSIVQLLGSWILYQQMLEPMGKWLWSRETAIVEVVANIPE